MLLQRQKLGGAVGHLDAVVVLNGREGDRSAASRNLALGEIAALAEVRNVGVTEFTRRVLAAAGGVVLGGVLVVAVVAAAGGEGLGGFDHAQLLDGDVEVVLPVPSGDDGGAEVGAPLGHGLLGGVDLLGLGGRHGDCIWRVGWDLMP